MEVTVSRPSRGACVLVPSLPAPSCVRRRRWRHYRVVERDDVVSQGAWGRGPWRVRAHRAASSLRCELTAASGVPLCGAGCVRMS